MLQKLAAWAMQGRWQAGFVTAMLSTAALILAPLSYLSGGIVALSALRMGPREGVMVVITATVVMGLIAGLLLGQPMVAALFLLTAWLPALWVALVLGYTRSLAMGVLAAGVLGLLVVVFTHLALPDPTAWWQQQLDKFAEILMQQEGWQLSVEKTQALMQNLAGYMTGVLAAGFTLSSIVSLFIGRGWQAKLTQPGKFAAEFADLHYGKQFTLFAVVVSGLVLSPLKESIAWLGDVMLVLIVLLALQGLAVVHRLLREQQRSPAWLFLVYGLLIVMPPQMMILLTILGVFAQWFNLPVQENE